MNNILIAVIVIILGLGVWHFLAKDDTKVEDAASENTPTETSTTPPTQTEERPPVTETETSPTPLPEPAPADTSETTNEPVTSAPANPVVNETPEPAPSAVSFNVKGVNYAFDVEEIRVKEGDTVTINFESSEGFHDWVVDEFSAATDKVRPGTPTKVTFVADQAGTYEYYCSVGSHRAQGMVGTLIVE